MLIFCITAPFLISAFTTDIALSTVMTFISVQTYMTLNEVARDVEDPFHYDPNELPLPQVRSCADRSVGSGMYIEPHSQCTYAQLLCLFNLTCTSACCSTYQT